MEFIGFIITGFVVGLIARALKPGDDSMGLLKTTVLGMVGAFLAGAIGRGLGWYQENEGAGFIASTIGAMVVLGVYYAISHRHRRIV